MKKIFVFISLCLICFISTESFALSAVQIMKKADEVFAEKTSLSISRMIITTSGGGKRSFLQWGMNMGSRSVSKFASGFVKGLTMLSIKNGDEIWVYFASSGRTRRLASSARNSGVAGSDFSYNDMSNTKYSKAYHCKLLSSSGSDYLLELKPKKGTDTAYNKLYVTVDKKRFIAKKIIYYNQDGEKFKRLVIKKVKLISGIITPMEFEMKNLITGNITKIEITKIKYLNRLRRIFFSSTGLSRSLETWKAVYPFFAR